MRYNTIYKNMQALGYSGVSLRLTQRPSGCWVIPALSDLDILQSIQNTAYM